MAFQAVGSLNAVGAPVLRSQIIGNSITVTENDSVKLASGFIALGTTGALVFGHVVANATRTGVGLATSGAAGAGIGTYFGAYTTASDNTTNAKVKATVDISKDSMYTASLTAVPGTTTGSNLAGYFMNLSTQATLSESSATTTGLQYFGWGLDPLNSAQVIVNVYQSVVFD